ncbi:hypothetical protein SEF58_13195, partial [Neomoorella humiferrea]|uniref:hypothetical protein n=1 Tax=Neomoorella humiferrea TaxID=676965 RepID=UPI003D93C298
RGDFITRLGGSVLFDDLGSILFYDLHRFGRFLLAPLKDEEEKDEEELDVAQKVLFIGYPDNRFD